MPACQARSAACRVGRHSAVSAIRGAAHRSPPMGELLSRGVVGWPGDPAVVAGLAGATFCWLFLAAARVSRRRAAAGQAGAPAAVAPSGARARTNELDAGKRWPMMGGGESLLVAGGRGR